MIWNNTGKNLEFHLYVRISIKFIYFLMAYVYEMNNKRQFIFYLSNLRGIFIFQYSLRHIYLAGARVDERSISFVSTTFSTKWYFGESQ